MVFDISDDDQVVTLFQTDPAFMAKLAVYLSMNDDDESSEYLAYTGATIFKRSSAFNIITEMCPSASTVVQLDGMIFTFFADETDTNLFLLLYPHAYLVDV